MIGRLTGTLVAIRPDRIVIDVHGLGLELAMAPSAVVDLPGVGEAVVVHSHLHVREEELSLYGFATEGDRDLFRILITASGIGPKVALALLSTLSADQVRRAVLTEDATTLATAPGIGKRSAQKLILELGPKLVGGESGLGSGGGRTPVREALESLGYTSEEIAEALTEVDEAAPVAEQVRAALRTLGQTRA